MTRQNFMVEILRLVEAEVLRELIQEEGEQIADLVHCGHIPRIAAEPLHPAVQPLGEGESDSHRVGGYLPSSRELKLAADMRDIEGIPFQGVDDVRGQGGLRRGGDESGRLYIQRCQIVQKGVVAADDGVDALLDPRDVPLQQLVHSLDRKSVV